ncbi:hypothetical protein V6N13_097497 [Hibiscus sabdariffa]
MEEKEVNPLAMVVYKAPFHFLPIAMISGDAELKPELEDESDVAPKKKEKKCKHSKSKNKQRKKLKEDKRLNKKYHATSSTLEP